jgi:CSLREA domain-containing protein
LIWPAAVAAETYFVNTAADEVDLTPGNEFCETAAGKCSLRAAIEETNALTGTDAIFFEEEPFEAGDPPITLSSELPAIAEQVSITGRECETGAGVFGPCVEIDGLDNAPALTIANVTVTEGFLDIESLAITDSEIGIEAEEVNSLRIRNNWLGVGVDGGVAGNQIGVRLGPGSEGARIGGEGPGTGNLFVASTAFGLDLLGASDVRVLGNVFGVTPTGAPAANGTDIAVASTETSLASDNTIGTRVGAAALATAKCDGGCNLVSNSGSSGIDLAGDGGERLPAVGATISGNQIGLDPSGEASLPNAGAGVLVGAAPRTVIGGPRAGDANSFAGGTAAVAAGPGAPYLVVRGNSIGSSAGPAGTADPPEDGILVDSEGLLLPAEEALILENAVGLDGGTGISQKGLGGEITGNSVAGAETGIRVFGEGAENLIEANSVTATEGAGILVENSFNQIVGNAVDGAGAAGIRVDGAAIPLFGVSGNVIGGDSPAEENTIAGSGGAAIEIENAELSQTEVARNRGGGNAGLFVDLVTADGEPEGPNGGILPPTIDVVGQAGAAGLTAPGATVRVFRKQISSPGEIESFLGQAVADEDGNWSLAFPAALPVGAFVAATQTNELGGTSELAIAAITGAAPGGEQSPGSSTADLGGDRRPPHTEILRQSKDLSRKNSVRFFFASNERGSRFQCSLDDDGFRGCKSPKRYGKLAPGKHVFRVRAIDRAGNVDPTPAKRRFRVLG